MQKVYFSFSVYTIYFTARKKTKNFVKGKRNGFGQASCHQRYIYIRTELSSFFYKAYGDSLKEKISNRN